MNKTIPSLLLCIFILLTLACRLTGMASPALTPAPVSETPLIPSVTPIPTLVSVPTPRIILQRLKVSFLGLDGNRLVGSGCPGDYARGDIVDFHFSVAGVDVYREVERIVVAGDNSTITWALPCSDNWELVAHDGGDGNWDLFVAPSEPSYIYTVFFFYSDHSMALGMTAAP